MVVSRVSKIDGPLPLHYNRLVMKYGRMETSMSGVDLQGGAGRYVQISEVVTIDIDGVVVGSLVLLFLDEKDNLEPSHRVASFDTSVFYLQNAAAKVQWPLSDDDEHSLKLAFAMKLGNDVANVVSKSQSKVQSVSEPKSPARSTKRVKPDKKAKRNKGEQKAKSKLLKGGNDEMKILASLGLMHDSPSCDIDDIKHENKKAKKCR